MTFEQICNVAALVGITPSELRVKSEARLRALEARTGCEKEAKFMRDFLAWFDAVGWR
ncbi:MAG: hypothetical protein J2P55_16705 [Rhizobiales bacterium]|nr:hypothetical protein [Hyphomicrobiales bacterium]